MIDHKEIKKYINPETGRLKEGIDKQLNHNPLIDDHICDSMENIQSTMVFLMNFLITPERGETRELACDEQEAIHCLLSVSHSALKFENERALHLMQNYGPKYKGKVS